MKITRPVKNIPQNLIYQIPNTNLYRIFRKNEGQMLGEMIAYPIENNIFIESLIIYRNRREGLGRTFLDFAKNLSKKYGFKGRMSLEAGTLSVDPFNPPHIFYRKYGFSVPDKKLLKTIDEHISQNKQLDYLKTPLTIMYYNPTKQKKENNCFYKKLKQILKNLW